MKIKQIIWDWNGTLLDDIEVCLDTINTLLSRHGLRKLADVAEYREFFGFPIEAYYRRLGFDFERNSFEALADEYIELYNRNFAHTRLFRGAEEVLRSFRSAGIMQSVISATRRDRLREQLLNFGISGYFKDILGIGDHLAAGKLDIAREWIKNAPCLPSETVFIGDTEHDCEVAREAGAGCILIANGHHSTERLTATGATVVADITGLPEMLI